MDNSKLKATPNGQKILLEARRNKKWTQTGLASQADVANRQLISNMEKGEPVHKRDFEAVCRCLGLTVEDIAERPPLDIEILATTIRNKIAPQIKQECGTMQVLDMVQEIGLGEIYTDVNILESLPSRRYVRSVAELYEQCCNEQGEFDRLGWGRPEKRVSGKLDTRVIPSFRSLEEVGWGRPEKRVSGLEAVAKYAKLMILGKPGAGKTTFLKHIAMAAMAGKLDTWAIPIFLSLKAVADDEEGLSLLMQIHQKFKDYGVPASEIELLLEQGRCLLLLDGLDEVLQKNSLRIIKEIQALADHPLYGKNQILVTCRIAAKEYLFKGFREVEVADFNWQQIESFVGKWFAVHDAKGKKAEKFMAKLKDDEPIQELASSPLLLTLLCLIFGDINDFRRNRAELYEEGVDILLKKWDGGKRGIERDQIYRQLSPKRKEDLLSSIAFEMFQKGNIFFKQDKAEILIERFIQNLPEAAHDPEALRLDSKQVLKAIEAQHGLLVARAKGIYSFSHLTFQEYFTARMITLLPSEEAFQALAKRVSEKKWREVIFLTVEKSEDATELMIAIKQHIDGMVAGDETIQRYLQWLAGKVDSLAGEYTDKDIQQVREDTHLQKLKKLKSVNSNLTKLRYFYLSLSLSLYTDRYRYLSLSSSLDYSLYRYLYRSLDHSLYRYLYRSLDPDHSLYLDHDPDHSLYLDLDHSLYLDLKNIISQLSPPLISFKETLESFLNELPDPENPNTEIIKKWRATNGNNWRERLRKVMIEHRNIKYDWQFTDEQKALLKRYKDANDLLLECLGRECYIDRPTREKIETELFLPQSRL